MPAFDTLENTQLMTWEQASYDYRIYARLQGTLFKNYVHHDMVYGLDTNIINAKTSGTMTHPATLHPINTKGYKQWCNDPN